jgi:hypothetical protein
MIALFVTRELERFDIRLLFVKIDVDGSTAMGEMVLGVLRQFDRLHSRLSAEKGKAGELQICSMEHGQGADRPRGI